MKIAHLTLIFWALFAVNTANAQLNDSTAVTDVTFRNQLYTSQFGIGQIGGYAQIDYNQPFANETFENGTFDVHRLVLFVGHKFSDKLSFFSEIEVEHVKEIYLEQAFLEYSLTSWLNLRAGMLLIPMGIVNEYHEPPTFNSVERPNLDKYIIPTTWREIGAGFSGNLPAAALNYQLYIVNGPLGYKDGEALFRGKDGIRGGRQKGAKSTFSGSPNLTTKVNYYGFKGLTMGLAGYIGKSQTTAYQGIDHNDEVSLASADSTVIGVSMIGADFRYRVKGFQLRGQYTFANLTNTDQYNSYTGSDLGSQMVGFFIEPAFDVLSLSDKIKTELIVFARYEQYNTHASTAGDMAVNEAYDRTDITAGLHFKPSPRTSFKIDYQYFLNASSTTGKNQLNMGVGVWF